MSQAFDFQNFKGAAVLMGWSYERFYCVGFLLMGGGINQDFYKKMYGLFVPEERTPLQFL